MGMTRGEAHQNGAEHAAMIDRLQKAEGRIDDLVRRLELVEDPESADRKPVKIPKRMPPGLRPTVP
jgi:2-methylcitrate dehydratase PrpD